ncbi:zinc finger protein glis1 [Pitangus sulphuratus]|nr:zinc finger protein glis1 [Pitangus sulphuratus]
MVQMTAKRPRKDLHIPSLGCPGQDLSSVGFSRSRSRPESSGEQVIGDGDVLNGGYNHCNLISEKKTMMDMEMTSSSVPVCRQGLFIHTGNSLMREHPLSRERLLHVGQLNLAHSDVSLVKESLSRTSEGIDITAIIRTSQTSLVTCVNGLRTNAAGISSHPVEISHHSAQKSSQPQSCSQPGNPCSIPSPPACLVPLSADCDRGDCEQIQMQQVEENGSLSLMMNGTGIAHQNTSHSTQKVSFLKQEPADDYSSSADLFRHHQGLPPPYHLHQQLSQTQGTLPHLNASMSPKSLQPSDGDEQDLSSGKQVCQWIDCSATYDQQDELVRHIEKTHIDQRKGEDFTCFWAGCVRRYKPFNARYKLLIHMRVHSGEKPNKCMDPQFELNRSRLKLMFLVFGLWYKVTGLVDSIALQALVAELKERKTKEK